MTSGDFLRIDSLTKIAYVINGTLKNSKKYFQLVGIDLKNSTGTIKISSRSSTAKLDRFCLSGNVDSQSKMFIRADQSGAYTSNVAGNATKNIYDASAFGLAWMPAVSILPSDASSERHVFYTTGGFDDNSIPFENGFVRFDFDSGKAEIFNTDPWNYVAISFDNYTGKLYGVRINTEINPSKYQLVQIDVASLQDRQPVNAKMLWNLPTSGIAVCGSFDLDDNDRAFFLTYSATAAPNVASVDIAANRSWYVCSSTDKDFAELFKWMHDAGYVMGQRDWAGAAGQTYRTVFAFGAAKKSGGQFGATGYGRFISVAKIKAAVLKYAAGWAEAVRGNKGVKLEIVVGTSNNVPSQLTAAHGAEWAKLADDIKGALPTSYAAQIAVVGGIDIEAGWSAVAPVKDWLAGYGAHDLVNFGDLNRCYLKDAIPDCGGDDKKTWVWKVSDFIDVNRNARMIPQIYSMTQARQWAHFAKDFKAATKKTLPIEAPLSQARICWQNGNKGCSGMNNSSEAAWEQLNGLLPASLNAGLGPTTDIADNPFKIPNSKHCPAPKPTGSVVASEAAAPDFVGINPQREGLDFPKGLYHTWSGKVDGRWRSVSAGYAFADPSQGVVVTDDPDKHILYPPEATGPLTIVSERDGVLVLKGDGGVFENPIDADSEDIKYQTVHVAPGKTYRFDVRKGEFIN